MAEIYRDLAEARTSLAQLESLASAIREEGGTIGSSLAGKLGAARSKHRLLERKLMLLREVITMVGG